MRLRMISLSFTSAIAVLLLILGKGEVALGNPTDDYMIRVDGSSTVYPITEAVAEEFGKVNKQAKITVGISGTGGGFKKFCIGEVDIADASRPIKQTELDLCLKNDIKFIELPVAYDALSVVVHPHNNWATSMTVKELRKLWEPAAQGKILRWSQIRPEWPNTEIALFGAGVDSGTYDYFTEVIVGTQHSSRGDFTSSEDDNILVQGVSQNKNGLGFFGAAYYTENANRIKAVAIDDENAANGEGPQLPTEENVLSGKYEPLSRPLFIYVSTKALDRPLIKNFISYYLKNAGTLADEVGYVRLSEELSKLTTTRFETNATGTMFAGKGASAEITLTDLMRKSTPVVN